MGNTQSIKKVNFEDIQQIWRNNQNILLINTLSDNNQSCLIKGTVSIKDEIRLINEYISKPSIKIIVYGKNTSELSPYKKIEQLIENSKNKENPNGTAPTMMEMAEGYGLTGRNLKIDGVEVNTTTQAKSIIDGVDPDSFDAFSQGITTASYAEGKINEGPKFDEVKANMEKTMGLLVRKMGLKSVGRYLVGKGGMSFFLDDSKEAKKLQKYLQAKIKDVRLINLDKDGGDEANFVVYAKVFDF